MPPSQADSGGLHPPLGFRGRDTELAELAQMLHPPGQATVVSVIGPGGIGKSSLAEKFATDNEHGFDTVCWCDFKHSKPLHEVLDRILRSLEPAAPAPAGVDVLLDAVVELLTIRPALVVLDNLETVMEPRGRSGEFEDSHELLATFISRVARGVIGALLLTSRDQPRVVQDLEGPAERVRSIALKGVEEDTARGILVRGGLVDDGGGNLDVIAAHHGRNPYALKIVARAIALGNVPGGVDGYVRGGCPLPAKLEELLDVQYERLSRMERVSLLRVAANRLSISSAVLSADLAFRYADVEPARAVASLRERGLLDGTVDDLDLQNVLREYCTRRLVDLLTAEVLNGEIEVGRDVSLLNPDAPSYISEAQRNLVLRPVAERLGRALPGGVRDHVLLVIAGLRGKAAREVGFAGGNLVNILAAAGASLSGADLTRQVLWRCQLEGTELHDVDAGGSDFEGSTFSSTFGEVTASRFSSDGQLMIAGTSDGSLRIWSTSTWLELPVSGAHQGYVRDLVILEASPPIIVSAGADGAVRCWDCTSAELVAELSRATEAAARVLAHDPHEALIAVGRENGSIEVWDVADALDVGEARYLGATTVHAAPVRGLAFRGRDGSLLSVDEAGVLCGTTCDTTSGPTTEVQRETGLAAWYLAISDDESTLVLGGQSGQVLLLDADSLEDRAPPLSGPGSPGWGAAFSPVGDRLYVATSRGDVVVVASPAGTVLDSWSAHVDAWIRTLALHPSGDTLATGGGDRAIRLWNVATADLERTFTGYSRSFWALAFGPAGQLATGGNDGSIYIWDAELKFVARIPGDRWIRSLVFHPSEPLLAVGDDRGLRLRDLEHDRWYDLSGDMCPVWDVAFSPAGDKLAAACEDNRVRCWIVGEAWPPSRRFSRWRAHVRRHRNWVTSVTFDPTGRMLASGDANGVVLIGPPDGPVRELAAATADQVWALGHLEGTQLVAAGRDGVCRRWDYGEETPGLAEWPLGTFIWSVVIDRYGRDVYLGGDRGTAVKVNAGSGEVTAAAGDLIDDRVHAVALSPLQPWLGTAGADGIVRIWDLTTGSQRVALDPDRLYARLNIRDATHLSDAQRTSLIDLGAVERAPDLPEAGDGQQLDVSPGREEDAGVSGGLSGAQYGQLLEGLLSAFPTRARLAEVVLVRCDRSLDEIVFGENLREVTLALIKAAEAEGWTARLVAGARESNPGNAKLADIAAKLGLAVTAPALSRLELMIDADAGLLDPVVWRERLGKLETQVCQIEYAIGGATACGTGFLVGPDLVMTNHHVIAPVLGGKADPATVRVRFDFKKLQDGATVNPGTLFMLAVDWCVDSSPSSELDELSDTGTQLPLTTELDYAVLRLSERAGDMPLGRTAEPGAQARGWIEAGAKSLEPGATVFILQHPQRSPLQLAIDEVIAVNANGTRLRYRANTLPGSSGSPCFDINLNLAALHHSGDPNYPATHKAAYNEGIPVGPILSLLETRGLREIVLAPT